VHRVINCEEQIGKVVGRRVVPPDPLQYASGLQKTLWQLNPPRIPKGVFRFRTHEEADQWLMKHLTRSRES
jgi:hypothetical protein